MASTLVGVTIGHYRVVERLGRGGMAEVYKAVHEDSKQVAAIKILMPWLAEQMGFIERFRSEARVIAALDHPNVVRVLEYEVFDEYPYILMEFLDGATLREELDRAAARGRLFPMDRVLKIMGEICYAMDYAHRRRVVHRDLKPENVMFADRDRVVVTDFGLSKILGSPDGSLTGGPIGSPGYMAPEVVLGEPGSRRSDIYALGLILYEMVTGVRAYSADTALAVVVQQVNAPLTPPREVNRRVPEQVEQVILKAAAKDLTVRYWSAEEFAQDLESAVRGELPIAERSPQMVGTGLPPGPISSPPGQGQGAMFHEIKRLRRLSRIAFVLAVLALLTVVCGTLAQALELSQILFG